MALFKKKEEETTEEETETTTIDASAETTEKAKPTTEAEKQRQAMIDTFYNEYGGIYDSEQLARTPQAYVNGEILSLMFATFQELKKMNEMLKKATE